MKVSERLAIIKRISNELQSRYNFAETFAFLHAFIPKYRASFEDFDNPSEMASYALTEVQNSVLGEMIDDLGIELLAQFSAQVQPPVMWSDPTKFKVFISHLAIDKDKATRLREALDLFGCKAFVAHEDIEPTLEWQVQIERALRSMDLFLSVHTAGYSKSVWSQQEIGFAVAKGAKIIAIRMGEDPTGFISKNQALSRGSKTADEIATEIDLLLMKDERTSGRYLTSKETYLSADVPF